MPVVIYALLVHVSKIKVGTLVVNIGSVLYMVHALWRSRQSKAPGAPDANAIVRQRTDASGWVAYVSNHAWAASLDGIAKGSHPYPYRRK